MLDDDDEALTTVRSSFNVRSGKVRWTYTAPDGGGVHLDFAAAGGGAFVFVTGGHPERYRCDREGRPKLLVPN